MGQQRIGRVYNVTDPTTGNKHSLEWFKLEPPTQDDIRKIFEEAGQTAPAEMGDPERIGELRQAPAEWKEWLSGVYTPAAVGTGAAVGTMAGTASSGPVGGVVGGTLGGGMGRSVARLADQQLGLQEPPASIPGALIQGGKDVYQSAQDELFGLGIGAVATKGGGLAKRGVEKVASKLAAPVHGAMTGVGSEASRLAYRGGVEEALKGTSDFVKAMRGDIPEELLAAKAQNGVKAMKEEMMSAFERDLDLLPTNEINTQPIYEHLEELSKQFNVRSELTPKGVKLDISRLSTGKKNKKEIVDIYDRLMEHGSQPGDNTLKGLHQLAREIGDEYSDSKRTRAFIASIRNKIQEVAKAASPEYAQMNKKYSDMTDLLSDVEVQLIGQEGKGGSRTKADRTLKKLMKTVAEKPGLRKTLVETIGEPQLWNQLAGTAMKEFPSQSMLGKMSMHGYAALTYYVSPKFLVMLGAASPRVSGEFLRAVGKYSTMGGEIASANVPQFSRAIQYWESLQKERQERSEKSE